MPVRSARMGVLEGQNQVYGRRASPVYVSMYNGRVVLRTEIVPAAFVVELGRGGGRERGKEREGWSADGGREERDALPPRERRRARGHEN
jgi:hypothetical protein